MKHPARRHLWCVLATTAVILGGLAVCPARSGDKTSLWKVSSGKGTAYLLGSIHLLKKEDYPLDPRIDRAFDEAEVVVFEVDPDSLQAPSLQSYILQNAMCGQGETLASELGDSVYGVASARAESVGVDLGPMSGFKPWFVAVTLPLAEMQKMGFDPALGIEMHFAEKAESGGKTVVGLETAKYQLGLFVTLTKEEQRDLLMHALSQLADIEGELNKIIAGWKNGDLEAVQETLNRSFNEFPGIYRKLVTQRNENWVAQIDGFLHDGRT
jgi:uncharacterized protein YbaP (TraB family)